MSDAWPACAQNYENCDRVEAALHARFRECRDANGRRISLAAKNGAGTCGGKFSTMYYVFVCFNVHGPDGSLLAEARPAMAV